MTHLKYQLEAVPKKEPVWLDILGLLAGVSVAYYLVRSGWHDVQNYPDNYATYIFMLAYGFCVVFAFWFVGFALVWLYNAIGWGKRVRLLHDQTRQRAETDRWAFRILGVREEVGKWTFRVIRGDQIFRFTVPEAEVSWHEGTGTPVLSFSQVEPFTTVHYGSIPVLNFTGTVSVYGSIRNLLPLGEHDDELTVPVQAAASAN